MSLSLLASRTSTWIWSVSADTVSFRSTPRPVSASWALFTRPWACSAVMPALGVLVSVSKDRSAPLAAALTCGSSAAGDIPDAVGFIARFCSMALSSLYSRACRPVHL